MQILNFKQTKEKSPFAPNFEFNLGIVNISNEINLKKLFKDLLQKEKYLKETYPSADHGGTYLNSESVTTRYPYYTLWQYQEFKYLMPIIAKYHDIYCKNLNLNIDKIYSQAWFNVLRMGEVIKPHEHNFSKYSYLSAHLTVNAIETNTYYYEPYTLTKWAEKNINGTLSFFPSWVTHETDKVSIEQERVTIAIDIYNTVGYNEDIIDDKKHRWLELCK